MFNITRAPKASGKRIFLFTDDDDPELGNEQVIGSTQKIVEVGVHHALYIIY